MRQQKRRRQTPPLTPHVATTTWAYRVFFIRTTISESASIRLGLRPWLPGSGDAKFDSDVPWETAVNGGQGLPARTPLHHASPEL